MTAATESGRAAVREAVASIRPVIETHRDDGERERRPPEAIVTAMREAGLFKLWTPKEYGGSEVDLPTFMAAVEEVSRIDGAAGWTFANLAAGNMLAAFLPEDGAKEIYSKGPSVTMPGSSAPNGRAIPVDGGYTVSGRWPLASGCHYGDWLGGMALVFDGDVPRMLPGGPPDLLAVAFRPDDCQILDTWNSVGLRGTGSTDFAVTDVFVPDRRAFPFFTAAPRVSGPLYKAGILPLFSFAITSVLLGIARSGIEAFVELAKVKTPTMSQTGLATRPTIHAEVARAEALVQSSRAYLYEVASEIMAAVTSGKSIAEDLEAKRRLACVNAGASCTRAVDSLFALAGATPVYTGHRLERCLRDIRTAGQHLFVSPVWWEKTGQYYFGLGLGMP